MFDYEYYDFNGLISQEDRDNVCESVASIISNGQYFQNSPKFQTNINVFGLPQPYWMKLKMSFIYSVFAFLDKEVQIKKVQSWSYQTSLKYKENRDMLWHNHNTNGQNRTVSGIYYVHLPEVDNVLEAGTEFAPNGPEADGKFFLEPKIGQWLIYPGSTWHRPGILQSNEDRYIVAADLEY